MNKIKLLMSLFLLVSSLSVFALEIDEKLTFRILDISSSKKTILLNRGVEDGLAVGDHAKFFVTSGVIARAVVIKVSPTRSIWSVYRLVSPKIITKNKVLNLKISSPVKLTQDPSRALKETRDTGKVAIAPQADDIEKDLSKNDMDDLNSLTEESANQKTTSVRSTGLLSGSWSPFVYAKYGSYGTTTINDGVNETTQASTATLVGAGIEKYFDKNSGILEDFSIYGMAELSASNSYEDGTDGSSFKQIGAGASYNFFNSPFSYGKPILFLSAEGLFGTSEIEYGGTTASGSVMTVNAGGGVKYNYKGGLGIKLSGLYSSRAESYSFSESSITEITVNATGFAFQAGLTYRF